MKILEEALRLRKCNMSVIPVGPDKKPLIKWLPYQQRIATEEEIKQWWTDYPNAQLGIVTGKISNIAVIDIEAEYGSPKDLNLPRTTAVKTGGGGYHFYYTMRDTDDINNKARVNNKPIDIRAEGGYVIAPPSVSDKGKYEYVLKTDVLPFFPMWFIDGDKESTNNKEQSEYYDLQGFNGSPNGSRNQDITSYIGSLLTKIKPWDWESIAWPQTQLANSKNSPPLPEHELRNTFESVKASEMRDNPNGRDNTQNGNKAHHEPPVASEDVSNFESTPVSELMDMITPEFPYLVDRLVPKHAITSITADSGKGKSLISWILAKHIGRGEDFFDFKVDGGNVLIVDQEMDKDLIIGRAKAVFEKRDNVHIMSEKFWMINIKEHFDWMVNHIKKNDFKLLILDTLTNIHNKEENSASEMRDVNKLLLKLIADTGVTIIYLHHHKKQMQGEARGQGSSRGSTEIIAKVASHLLIDTKDYVEDDNRVLEISISQEKARRPESINKIGIKVFYNYQTNKTTYEYMGEIDDKKNKTVLARNFILDVYDGHPNSEWTFQEIKQHKLDNQETGFGDNAIRGALKEMEFEGLLTVSLIKRTKLYKLNEKKLREINSGLEASVRESQPHQSSLIDEEDGLG